MKGVVYNNGLLAGSIEKDENGYYLFQYDDGYFADKQYAAVSLTLPKTQKEYRSKTMFAFFFGLLSEGINKDIQCRLYKIDENDDFIRLLLTTRHDTIGSITVKPEDDKLFKLLY